MGWEPPIGTKRGKANMHIPALLITLRDWETNKGESNLKCFCSFFFFFNQSQHQTHYGVEHKFYVDFRPATGCLGQSLSTVIFPDPALSSLKGTLQEERVKHTDFSFIFIF